MLNNDEISFEKIENNLTSIKDKILAIYYYTIHHDKKSSLLEIAHQLNISEETVENNIAILINKKIINGILNFKKEPLVYHDLTINGLEYYEENIKSKISGLVDKKLISDERLKKINNSFETETDKVLAVYYELNKIDKGFTYDELLKATDFLSIDEIDTMDSLECLHNKGYIGDTIRNGKLISRWGITVEGKNYIKFYSENKDNNKNQPPISIINSPNANINYNSPNSNLQNSYEISISKDVTKQFFDSLKVKIDEDQLLDDDAKEKANKLLKKLQDEIEETNPDSNIANTFFERLYSILGSSASIITFVDQYKSTILSYFQNL